MSTAMDQCRTILFPVDFSEAAVAAVPYVREMTRRCRASLTVLHAFHLVRGYDLAPPYDRNTGAIAPAPIPYVPVLRELRLAREQRLKEFAEDQFEGIDYCIEMEDGEPSEVIEWVSQRRNSDLIMMPTRGLGRFRRLLLGSVTAKALHDIRHPVWTNAHSPDPALAAADGYCSILCAAEMNEEAESVVKTAAFLAKTFTARLCLVHIQSSPAAQEEMQSAAALVRRRIHGFLGADAEAKVRVLDGSVGEGIRSAAIEEKANLVVVGRGHATKTLASAWSRLYTIIRESPCPVLSV